MLLITTTSHHEDRDAIVPIHDKVDGGSLYTVLGILEDNNEDNENDEEPEEEYLPTSSEDQLIRKSYVTPRWEDLVDNAKAQGAIKQEHYAISSGPHKNLPEDTFIQEYEEAMAFDELHTTIIIAMKCLSSIAILRAILC
ncbi:hypothetical protein ACFE04_021714 [Oxalis oulophora]